MLNSRLRLSDGQERGAIRDTATVPSQVLLTGMGFAGQAAFRAALKRDHGSTNGVCLPDAEAESFVGHAVWGAASSSPATWGVPRHLPAGQKVRADRERFPPGSRILNASR